MGQEIKCQVASEPGTLIMEVEVEGEDVKVEETATVSPDIIEEINRSYGITNEKFLASPAVRFLVKSHNLDVSKVSPTGRGGRIRKNDILQIIDQSQSKQSTPKQETPSKQQNTIKTETNYQIGDIDLIKLKSIIKETMHEHS